MARYSTGQPVRISTTVKDVTGTLTNPTALTLTVLKPDASTQAYATPVNDGTGLYHQDIPVSDLGQTGHYAYKWTSTGTAAGESFGDFDVFDPFEPAVLPLSDAKDMLNIPQSSTGSDSELQAFIATIGTSLERMTGGPLVARTVTERVEATAGQSALVLRQRPLVALTSVTSVASGTAITITDMELDVNAGIIRRKLGLPFIGPYFSWLPVFTVVYTAGWVPLPAAFNIAARIILAHLWETQHGPSSRPQMGGDDLTQIPGFGFAIPNRAAELLDGAQAGIPFRVEAFV